MDVDISVKPDNRIDRGEYLIVIKFREDENQLC